MKRSKGIGIGGTGIDDVSVSTVVNERLRHRAFRAFVSFAVVMAAELTMPFPQMLMASAHADFVATVKARTQRMSQANLGAQQNGWYEVGQRPTLVCSTRGQAVKGFFSFNIPGGWDNLWYRTSDGQYVADVDIETGSLGTVVPDCGSAQSNAGEPAHVDVAGRAPGRTQTGNPGVGGQCTWGAAQKWFEASGSYPALRGGALGWADSARATGWTVVDDAQPRSIVVFKPGVQGASGAGHVAWVDSVSQRGDGRWIHVTEMNNSQLGGVGIFNDRDVKDVPGMSFILLP